MAIFASTGADFDINKQIGLASSGDSVTVPAGTFNWGSGGLQIGLNKTISLLGAGPNLTYITIDPAAPAFGNGVVAISSGGLISGFTFIQPSGTNLSTTAINTNGPNGWRITSIGYTGTPNANNPGYFVYAGTYGLIDNCNTFTKVGTDELIVSRGPSNSWTTPNSYGTANAVYVEDCTMNGIGYTCDMNSNARGVIRFNSMANLHASLGINGSNKIDGHGVASNSPPQGVRQIEAYNNAFYQTGFFTPEIEIRGGTCMIFNNSTLDNAGFFYLTDYGYQGQWSSFNFVEQTLSNYPIGYQIGCGQDITINATGIKQYQMVTILTPGTTNFVAYGSPDNNIGTQFIANATPTGNGTVTTTPAATEPAYVWGNTALGGPWQRFLHVVDAGAIALYTGQQSNPSATFAENNVIKANRDFYGDAGFDVTTTAATGVSVGTTAQMNAFSTNVTGYGWWVTDQGSWNQKVPANTAGLLYSWQGQTSGWVLKYTPYTYPHPLRNAAQTVYFLKRLGNHIKMYGYTTN